MSGDKRPVKLFWTGGWDSTFRLIQLTVIYGRIVQPYYILDPGRNSTLFEIKAMTKIKEMLFLKYPQIKKLILPTHYADLTGIPVVEEISQSYMRLTKIETIGIQYEWLARFCATKNITDMEISNETAIYDADNRTRKLLGDDLDRIEITDEVYYKLNDKAKGKDVYNIYGCYKFPVFDFTKQDMYNLSLEMGFDDVMNLTWFCHMPTRFSKPCGKCHPCRVVYREGLKWRLPFVAKMRYHTWPTLRIIARFLRII